MSKKGLPNAVSRKKLQTFEEKKLSYQFGSMQKKVS